jgi:hypothetical protein
MDEVEQDEIKQIDIKQPGVMFDKQLVELFRPVITEAFLAHVDVLRSVIISFDYHGPLNDTEGINKGVWLGPDGAQTDPAGIIGSAGVTLQAAATILDRGFQLLDGVRGELQVTLQDLHERKQELEQIEAKIEGIRNSGNASSEVEDTTE